MDAQRELRHAVQLQRVRRTAGVAMISQLVTYPASPEAGPACPLCGHARRIIIDGLTGTTQTVCDECPRRAELARRQQAFDSAAIARVAGQFGISVDVAIARLSNSRIKTAPPPKPAPVCWICTASVSRWGSTKEATRCAEHKPRAMRAAVKRAEKQAKKQAREAKRLLRVSHSVAGRRWGYCLVCDVALDYVRGRGRPPCYCDAHRPAYLKRQNADRAAASLARAG